MNCQISFARGLFNLVIDKSSTLKSEFERLAKIQPTTAAEADALASRMNSLGSEIRSNIKDFVSLNKQLQTVRLDAIMANTKNVTEQLDREMKIINHNIKSITGGSLFGDSFALGLDFMIPDIPQSAYEKQRKENEKLIAEEQRYQDEILKMTQTALRLQDEENKKASAEQRKQLLDDLNEAKSQIQKHNDFLKKDAKDTGKEIEKVADDSLDKILDKTDITVKKMENLFDNMRLKIAEIDTTNLDKAVDAVTNGAKEISDKNGDPIGGKAWGGGEPSDYSGVQGKPFNGYKVTSGFGWRVHPITKQRKMHNGIDFGMPMGTPIRSNIAGTVTTNSYQAGGAGNYISIKDANGYTHTYMHMQERSKLPVGQEVKLGNTIGLVGSTGASTGAHLHYGVKNPSGSYVNPVSFYEDGGVHQGGKAVVGEKGREMGILPNGKVIILGQNGAGLYDLPIGTQVINHKETEKILNYTGNIDGQNVNKIDFYADGTGSSVNIGSSLSDAEIEKLRKSIDDLNTTTTTYSKEFVDAYIAFQNQRSADVARINELKSAGLITPELLELSQKRMEQDLVFSYNLQIQVYEEKAKILAENYQKLLAEYKAIQGTASADVLQAYQQGLISLQDEMMRIDEQWRQAKKSLYDYGLIIIRSFNVNPIAQGCTA